ncbi:MAG: aminotransferase class I/II-fold pyridoxal phosphate-dependent enzyme [Bacteroidota bacterium]
MVETLKSKRLQGTGEYYFSSKLREIEQLNVEGKNILNLGIGSPDQAPSESVKKSLVDSLDEKGFHQYQSYKGLPELRSSFSAWYKSYFEVALDPDTEILPLIGSKEGIMHISMSFLDEGDQVLIPNPGYPTYASVTRLAGGTAIPYNLKASNSYLPDFYELEKLDLSDVKIMWVNYPHMPTGKEGTAELFEKLRAFSRRHKIIIVNDNPYGFILTDKQLSILKGSQQNDLILELNSLSKSHNMAGWRVGVLAGHKELIQTVLTFKSNMDSGMFKPIMRAASEALSLPKSWYKEINQEYSRRRVLVCKIADVLGCSFDPEQVGMFLWCRIPSDAENGKEFADYLLQEYRIFVPPGMIFGSEGDQYIRFSLCSTVDIWEQVIKRIQEKRKE